MSRATELMEYIENQLRESLSSFTHENVQAETMAAVKYQVEVYLHDLFPYQDTTVKVFQLPSDPNAVMVILPEWLVEYAQKEDHHDYTRQPN